jgi:hypothetical protein
MPAGTVNRLYSEFKKAVEGPQVNEKLGSQAANVVGNQPDEFAAIIRRELEG